MQIRVIDSLDEFTALRDDWDRVYGSDPDAQFFLSWSWLSQWLPMLTSPWFILAAKPDNSAHHVAFMPFRVRIRERKQGEFRNELNMAGNYQADYTGLICDADFDAGAIPAFARYLGKLHWARIHLENIRTTDDRLRLFLKGFSGSKFNIKSQERINKRDNINNCICPFAQLPDNWDSYLNDKLSANTRQKIRRFLRQVDSDDSFRITHATADTIGRDVNILLQFWAAKWGQRKGNRLLNILNTNRDMLTRCFNAGLLFMPVFWKGDTPLGALAIYLDPKKKAFLFYMAGRDETFNAPPPGLILHAHSIQFAIQSGVRTYDFLRGNEPYKYSLATDERRIACMVVGTKNDRNLGDRLDMRTIPAALDRATDLHKSGHLKQAELAYRQIIQTDPKCAKALYYLGQLKASTGSHGAAKRLFKSLVSVKPDSEKAWLRLGHSLEARRRFREAADAYREVVKQQPTLALAHNKLGNALFRLGHFDDAVAAFDKALSLQPDYLEVAVSRSNTLHMLGRLSREELRQGAELNVKLGDKIRANNGCFAVHCYRQALKMKSDLVGAHYGLGQALQAQGDIKQAAQSYRKVVDLDPEYRDALALLSDLERPQHGSSSALHVNP